MYKSFFMFVIVTRDQLHLKCKETGDGRDTSLMLRYAGIRFILHMVGQG